MQVSLTLVRRQKGTGALGDVVDLHAAPRNLGSIPSARQGDALPVHHERILLRLDGALEPAVDGVVLKEVLHVVGRLRRVDVACI